MLIFHYHSIGLIWFTQYIPAAFAFVVYESLPLSQKLGICILPNSGMGLAFRVALNYEGTGEGLQWKNLFRPVSLDDNLSVGHILLVMLFSCLIYLVICLYVEQIYPGEFGIAKKWYFPLTARFWCAKKTFANQDQNLGEENPTYSQHPENFENEPSFKEIGLKVKNLKRKFGKKVAVNGVSLNMYIDEITVLLGHNGAGKTTTIGMITGVIPPTSGTAIINGYDIRTNTEAARMSLGFCPQRNILFEEMSVANHIAFFSCLKGVKRSDLKAEISKYLKKIDLEDKANVVVSKLSGGMKRKLSLCCAMCGDTKVVLCDEPSSGLDPAARRQLWDLLQAEKSNRTILLTTHFMDEADVLGDRIAIMSEGVVKCYGTSFFLKKQFGSGYRLVRF